MPKKKKRTQKKDQFEKLGDELEKDLNRIGNKADKNLEGAFDKFTSLGKM